jgi:hypothetical protein
MCAVGVDEMSWDDLNDEHYDWPSLAEVRLYRDQVRAAMDEMIMTLPLDGPINWESPWWPILMGIEHENIHLETSSAILRQCPTTMLKADHPQWDVCKLDSAAPVNSLVSVESTTVVYDKQSESSRVYGWDNEYGSKTADVAGFKASKYLCSNEEYLEFVSAGGYEQRQWWDDEGWTWVQYTGARHPKFWIAPASSDGGAGGGTPRPAGVIPFRSLFQHFPCASFLAVFLQFSCSFLDITLDSGEANASQHRSCFARFSRRSCDCDAPACMTRCPLRSRVHHRSPDGSLAHVFGVHVKKCGSAGVPLPHFSVWPRQFVLPTLHCQT